MEENRQKNSKRRLNSLILLVAFTAIMLIVSTYAWFSSQKNVTLTGLQGQVNVAEGLQISLDAEHWVNTIDFSDFDQSTAGAWTIREGSSATYIDSTKIEGATFQSPRGADGGITNTTPKELLPVSTTAYSATNDGIGQSAITFYRGTNEETIILKDDTKEVTENGTAGFFAFDVFVQNTSSGTAEDVIQLDPIADVVGNNEATGVQNTARVAFALYDNINDYPDEFSATAAGKDMTVDGKSDLTPEVIVAGTSTGRKIKDVAIWEPNANKHADSIVTSRANSLKLDAADNTFYGLTADTNTKISKFADGNKLPTYALTSLSKANPYDAEAKGVNIADVYDWRITTDGITTDAKGVKKQFTLQTDAYEADGEGQVTMRSTPVNLVSTRKSETPTTEETAANDTTFTLKPSQYQKIRIYFWMEGQDPDCINSASLGGGLRLDIGFSKPGTNNSGT